MQQRAWLKSSTRARIKQQNWFPAVAPFTIFLILVLVLYRTLTIYTVITMPSCADAFFWLAGWVKGLAALQLLAFIAGLSLIYWLFSLMGGRAGERQWREHGVQLALIGGLGFAVSAHYALYFPDSQITAWQEKIFNPRSGAVEFIPRELGGGSRYARSSAVLGPIIEKAEQESPFLRQADGRNNAGYYLLIKRDLSWEIIPAPDARPVAFANRQGLGDQQEQALYQCALSHEKFAARGIMIEQDPQAIWLEPYGMFFPYYRAGSIRRDDFDYMWPDDQ